MSKCAECKTKDKQIEELQQKLDYAIYQNQEWARNYGALEKSLKELRWQINERMLQQRNLPTLPNEIWFQILGYAVEFDGLPFSHVIGHRDGNIWATSLQTRRSIPLVCRQWAVVGTQFLYQYLLLRYSTQMSRLLTTLDAHPHYSTWCRYFGLFPVMTGRRSKKTLRYRALAGKLADCLNSIGTLAIDMNGADTTRNLMASYIQQYREKIKTLHVIPRPAMNWDLLIQEVMHIDTLSSRPTVFAQLHTLCITPGYSSGDYTTVTPTFCALRYPLLETVHFEWLSTSSENIYAFLAAHPRLTEIHISRHNTTRFLSDFERFIESVPSLTKLHISICGRNSLPLAAYTATPHTHQNLRAITIELSSRHDMPRLHCLGPIFLKIPRNELPVCKVIEVKGGSSDGCIDSHICVSPDRVLKIREFIWICERNKVAFMTGNGDKIHLWKDRHGFKMPRGKNLDRSASSNTPEAKSSDDESSSEDDGWTEEDARSLNPREPSEPEPDDDSGLESDDSPYVYHHLSDIRMVDEDEDFISEDEASDEES